MNLMIMTKENRNTDKCGYSYQPKNCMHISFECLMISFALDSSKSNELPSIGSHSNHKPHSEWNFVYKHFNCMRLISFLQTISI